MKVKCINGIVGVLTIGKIYDAIEDLLCGYTVINDNGVSNSYLKERFEIVEEFEDVLKLEYQEVFGDKVAIKVAYQNDKVLKRGEFADLHIGVASRDFPDFRFDITHIRGIRLDSDNEVSLVSKEKAEEIKEKVRRINEKYGIRTRWRAKEGCIYYYVDSSGYVGKCKDLYISVDDARYDFGNYFKTKTGAKKALEKIKQALKETNDGNI